MEEGQDEGENAAREAGSVHLMFMAKCHLRTRERVKGNTAFPFTIPAAPLKSVLRLTDFSGDSTSLLHALR
ncbi:hypothetical protein C9415_02020 [Kluyvera sp. Nf5]|nr:hypothetical protein C9415_02020 [Kluyvera sp. Nf5]